MPLNTNFIKAEGSRNSKIFFIGECPGAEEDAACKPFIGAAGQFLNRVFRAKGIIRSEILLGNIFNCRPPKNNVGYFYQDSTKKILTWEGQNHVDKLQKFLEKRLEERERTNKGVNLLVALGAEAMKHLTGKRRINKWRGSVLPCILVPGFKVYVTFHPSYVMRLINEPIERLMGEKKVNAQNVLPLFEVDFDRIKIQAQSSTFKFPQRKFDINPTLSEIVLRCKELLNEPYVAVDIETFFGEGGTVLWCIGFAKSPAEAFTIPFIKEGKFAWPIEDEATILYWISKVFLSKTTKIFQGGMYDLAILGRYYGLRLAKGTYADTMYCHHASYPYLRKALEILCSMYTWEPYYKCLLPTTEVLTKDGWISFKDLRKEIEVLQWHRDGKFSWTIPQIHKYEIAESMIRINSLRHKCNYTTNHDLPWISSKTKRLEKKSIGSLIGGGRFNLPVSGYYSQGKISVSWIKFLAAVQADGHIESKRVMFNLRKKRKLSRLKALCETIGIPWKYRTHGNIITWGETVEKTIQVLGDPKRFRSWILELDYQTLENLVEETQHWDGWQYSNAKAIWYSSKDKKNVEWIATAAHLIGRSTHIMRIQDKDQCWAEGWIVSIKNQDFVSIKPQKHFSKIDYKGSVFCLTTETGFFIARSEDHIFITGNSEGKYLGARNDAAEFRYNGKDCCVTREIYPTTVRNAKELGTWNGYLRTMSILPSHLGMTIRGIKIDQNKQKELAKIFSEKAQIAKKIIETETKTPINLNSSDQKRKLLYGFLGLEIQFNPKTKKPTTDKDALNKLKKKYPKQPILKELLNYQKYAKFASTYTSMRPDSDGRMRTSYSLVSTWRMNSRSSPFGGQTKADREGGNLQNIPKRGKEGKLIRSIFIPDEGKVLLASDRIQAEAMVVAWDSQDFERIQLFKNKEDTHWFDAKKLFGLPKNLVYNSLTEETLAPNNFTGEEHTLREYRDITKTVVYAGFYGMGAGKLQSILSIAGISIELKICKVLLQAQVSGNPFLLDWQRKIREEVRATRTLISPIDRKRQFLGRFNANLYNAAYAFKPQNTVGEITETTIQRIWEELDYFEILLNVHDEVVGQCKEEDVSRAIKDIRRLSSYPIEIHGQTLDIPVDFKVGPNWGELKEINETL